MLAEAAPAVDFGKQSYQDMLRENRWGSANAVRGQDVRQGLVDDNAVPLHDAHVAVSDKNLESVTME
jgi:hypothetical protein